MFHFTIVPSLIVGDRAGISSFMKEALKSLYGVVKIDLLMILSAMIIKIIKFIN